MCFHETNIAEIFIFLNNIHCNDSKFVGSNKTKNKELTIFSASKSLQHIRIQMTSMSPENSLRVLNSRKKPTSYSSRFLLLGTCQNLIRAFVPPGTRSISSLHLALKVCATAVVFILDCGKTLPHSLRPPREVDVQN